MTARLSQIIRHPIKAHGRELLASVVLSEGAALPWDRAWAVTHGLSKFDPGAPAWTPCGNFQRGARTRSLMAMRSRWEPTSGVMEMFHPALPDLAFRPADEGPRFIDWLAPISPEDERFRPVALVQAPGRAMTDSDWPSISIKSLSSHRVVGAQLGMDLSIHRWRGNLWLEGLAPFAERDWIGRRLRIGASVLEIRENIGRCKATTGNPETGIEDADTLGALRALIGVQEFGVYGAVVEGGEIRPDDKVELLS